MQQLVHFGLHFIFPFAVAYIFYREDWKKVGFIMVATILVDLDHLLADPIFDPNRCSINFHPLHTYPAIAIYTLLLLPKRTRIVAIGLLLHMSTDFLDCQWMKGFQ